MILSSSKTKKPKIGALVSIRMNTEDAGRHTQLTLNYTLFDQGQITETYDVACEDVYASDEEIAAAKKEAKGKSVLQFIGAGVVLTDEDKNENDPKNIPRRLVLKQARRNDIVLYDVGASWSAFLNNFGVSHGGGMLASKKPKCA